MITDKEAARLCRAIYAKPGAAVVEWDHVFDNGLLGIFCALKHYGDTTSVTFRGSNNWADWIKDLLALTDPSGEHYGLGPVHPLMFEGMTHVMDKIYPLAGDRLFFNGHSLGAARAEYATGLAILDGRKPVAGRVTFGLPKPGFARLKQINSAVPGRTYRNGHAEKHEVDFVTTVPFTLKDEEYIDPLEPTDVYELPGFDIAIDIFRFHHMRLYDDAMASVDAFTE